MKTVYCGRTVDDETWYHYDRQGRRIVWLKTDLFGLTTQEVLLVKETPKRYRIQAITQTRVWRWTSDKRSRWPLDLAAGETALVMKTRVFVTEESRRGADRGEVG